MQEQKLAALLNEDETVDAEKVTELLKTSRTSTGKIKMLLDIVACNNLSFNDVAVILDQLEAGSDGEDRRRPQSLINCVQTVSRLTELFRFLSELDDEEVPKFDGTTTDEIKAALDCDDRTASKLKSIYELSREEEVEEEIEMEAVGETRKLNLPGLLNCFAITSELFEKMLPDEPEVQLLRSKDSTASFFRLLCKACKLRREDTMRHLSGIGVRSRNLLEFSLETFVSWPRSSVASLSSTSKSVLQVAFDLLLPDKPKASDVTMHFYFPAQRILNHSKFSSALYFSLCHWRAFLSSNLDHFKRLVSEASHTLHCVESFLMSRQAYGKLCRKQQRGPFDFEFGAHDHTVDSVFGAGNGRIAEVICQWLADLKFVPKNLHHADSLDFTSALAVYFPRNVQFKTQVSHMAWEYLRRWSNDRSNQEYLCKAHQCLKSISHEAFARNLTILAYKTFLEKIVREAINVTEIRTAQRCQREIGVREEDLNKLLGVCVDILRLVIDNDPGVEVELATTVKFYDDLSSKVKPHLLDHLRTVPHGAGDLLALQYQFALVARLIWSYNIDVKPLKLFSNQESNLFFQSEGSTASTSSSSLSGLFTMTHNNLVTNYRTRFLDTAAEYVVGDSLYLVPDDDGGPGQLETGQYKEKQSHLSLLGKMWYLSDKVKEVQIIALYKEGYDSLGEEVLGAVSDRGSVGTRLLHVAILRLTKYVYESEDHASKLAVIKPELMSRFCQLQDEARELKVDPGLKACKEFFVFLCGIGLDDESMQINYECLSLVQIFMKQEGGKDG